NVHVQNSAAIADALRARRPDTAAPQPGLPKSSPGTTNPEAYDLYLRGSYLRDRRGAGVTMAVQYVGRAIGADRALARAYAGLGYALELMPMFGGPSARVVEHRVI